MNCYDVYRILDGALEAFLDSIALMEDPTEKDRKEYEMVNFWKPTKPDEKLEKLLKSLEFSEPDEQK